MLTDPVEIRCHVGGRVKTLLRATLGQDLRVRLIGLPEWVDRCQTVSGQTPRDGVSYLVALRDAFNDGRMAIAYGGAYAEVLS